MAKANILSYVQQRTLEKSITHDVMRIAEGARIRFATWKQLCRYHTEECGFTVTESNLRHMLQQLKIDPSEIIDIKQPKQFQKSKPAQGEIVDKLAEAKRLLDEVVKMYAESKWQ